MDGGSDCCSSVDLHQGVVGYRVECRVVKKAHLEGPITGLISMRYCSVCYEGIQKKESLSHYGTVNQGITKT